jgi:protein-tyrosine phosphatase
MIKVLFICHGNICRSPMAEFVLKDMVEKRGIADQYEIASAATSTEEIWGGRGNPIYPPAQEALRRHGIGRTAYTDFSGKRARQLTKADYSVYDYLLCADAANIRNTIRITGADTEGKIRLLLDYAVGSPHCGKSISDPWYTGDFESTYRDVEEGCGALLEYLLKKKKGSNTSL